MSDEHSEMLNRIARSFSSRYVVSNITHDIIRREMVWEVTLIVHQYWSFMWSDPMMRTFFGKGFSWYERRDGRMCGAGKLVPLLNALVSFEAAHIMDEYFGLPD